MDTRALQEIVAWFRSTDLSEAGYKRGSESFEFRVEGASPPSPGIAFPASPIVPVTSPGVGLFRWAPPGAPRCAREGKDVSQGETLGLLDTGGKPVEIVSPASGRILKALIDEGQAAEYGQALFLLSPSP